MTMIVARFLGFLFSWLTIGAVMGVVVVGGVLYIYAKDLPDHATLQTYEPATLSRVYSGDGSIMDEFVRQRRLFTPVDEIPELVRQAFLSAEDKRFYEHQGFDPRGMVSAFVDAVRTRGETVRGASTIPQQVAKISFLSGDRTAERKIREIILAARMVSSMERDKILEIYLNEIFLGQNSYGVTSAALTYFGKSLEDLTVEEAAYLAVLPKAPSRYHPIRQRERALDRRNFVLREMFQNGYLDEAAYAAARKADLNTVQSGQYASARGRVAGRDYFSDEIRRQLSTTLGEEELFSGGLSIRATVQPKLQNAAAAALRTQLEKYDRGRGIYRGPLAVIPEADLGSEESWRTALSNLRLPRDIEGWHPAVVLRLGKSDTRIGIEGIEEDEDGHWIPLKDFAWARPLNENGRAGRKPKKPADMFAVGDVIFVRAMTKDADGSFIRWTLRQIPEVQGGFMAMDVRSGRVLAMQGGFSYQDSVFNRATQATRQPGSSFKPFVYAAALDSGFSPATVVVDAPIEVETPQGLWRPQNASKRFYGPAPLRTGIEQSRNLMTVRVAQEIGMDIVGGYAERFGVYQDMPGILSYSLGAGETTLYKMVSAYAMFANGGKRVEPTLVDRVQDRRGKTVFRHDKRDCVDCELTPGGLSGTPGLISTAETVMDPVTAYQLTSMMQGVVARGTAASTVGKVLGKPFAGKTGTTNEAKDVWFIGFSPEIVAGCYIGYDQPTPMGRGAAGGTMCGPAFADFMKVALEDHGSFTFDRPDDTVLIKIDRFTGMRVEDGASGPNIVAELFRRDEEPFFGQSDSFIDGGWAMGSDLLLYDNSASASTTVTVTDSQGRQSQKKVLAKPSFGSLSSGGLY